MKRVTKITMALAALSVWTAAANAGNLLGLYAGAGVGESTVRSDSGFDPSYPIASHPHHTAYKAIVGIRPIAFVGAEVEYLDFGHSNSTHPYANSYPQYGNQNTADSHPKAGVVYAVGYLPLPFIDLFVKSGVARLETSVNAYAPADCTSASGCGPPLIGREHVWQTKAAYGAGVQGHIVGLGLRAEYQRISSSLGAPDAFMLSATWTF